MSLWANTREQLNEMVNRHFETPEYKQLFAVKLTLGRQKIWDLHYPHYIKSRRDCWGAAAGTRRHVMRHREHERRVDLRQAHGFGALDGRTDGGRGRINFCLACAPRSWRGCIYHGASLIEALTSITLRSENNPAIVKGGGFTARFAHKRVADQGGTIEGLDINTKVHMVADEDHSDMFEPIYDRYVVDERAAQAVIRAAQDSLAVDRAYRSALATAMAQIAESAAA
jgi:hypothetical protein